jgi:hypothetical protein
MPQILRTFFLPPLAVARVGGSDTPLAAFGWDTGRTISDANRTIVRPEVTLDVLPDGTLRPYLPNSIHFQDRGRLRPVAPFFELWAMVAEDKAVPVTLGLLDERGLSLESVTYTITVANRKAQRRTGSHTCAFVARLSVRGNDHERKPLLACSPHNPGEEPLVYSDRPIRLGHIQVIRPTPGTAKDVDLSVLRVRFTPGKGEVYGPPDATAAPASPLPPGGVLPTLNGRIHEIVPPQNRILNPNTPWSKYRMDVKGKQQDPQPSDSYDGANVGTFQSWGVVDDTCDGIIEAHLVSEARRFMASTRVFSCNPDYAPDRQPFFSFVDDLADRDLPPPDDLQDIACEVADLFARIFDTASLVNVEALRRHAIEENEWDPPRKNFPHLPAIDEDTMTDEDARFVNRVQVQKGTPDDRLERIEIARRAHGALNDVDQLIDVLRMKSRLVRRLIRPPFGRFKQDQESPPPEPSPHFRDPRVVRDSLHDMRMPPYMRDSDETPLSLTYRQYTMLFDYLEALKLSPNRRRLNREHSPAARRFARQAERLRKESQR